MLRKTGFSICIVALAIAGSSFIQSFSLPKSMERGKDAYTTYCQNCHMVDGKGTPCAFPPLAKSEFLKKPVKAMIDNVLFGQNGETTVNGQKYNGAMPAQSYLTDDQIADILNYVRNSWGNRSTVAVTPAQVKKARP